MHVDDVAAAIAQILRQEKKPYPVYELAGPRVYSYEELLRTIARIAGLQPVLMRMPFALWDALAGLQRCCRGRHSPAIRSNLCRSTLRPPKTCRGFAHLEFRRERSKTNSKRSSGKTNQEFRERDYTDCPALATAERLGGCDADAV